MTRRHLALLVLGVTAVSFSAVFVRLADAPALTIAFMGFVIVMLGWFEVTRVALYVGAAWLALLAAVFYARIRPKFAPASR